LDEATATWFEPLAVGKDSYVPVNVKSDLDFLFSPLFFPPDQPNPRATASRDLKNLDRKHGYGASAFFRYLTLNKPVGNDLIRDIYEEVLSDPDSASAAFNRALTKDNLQASQLWEPFLQTLITSPQSLYAGLNWYDYVYTQLGKMGVTLIAEPTQDQKDIKIAYRPSELFKRYNLTAAPGMAINGPDATMTVDFNLAGLSTDGFSVRLADGFSNIASMHSGKLTVSVSPSPGTGALVYAIPRDGSVPILSGVLPLQANSISVDNISDGVGSATYKGLLVVVYNTDDNVYAQEKQTIHLTISFKSLDSKPSPEAAPVDNDNSDLECDMRAISIMQNYGHGGTPEETEINNSCLSQALQAGVNPSDNEKYQEFICQCITRYLKDHAPFP
ncbi:MAG: hypothetical protein MUO77_01995, partial [Anaerolineales bacterium]|nr:hypothetical protein [Anaerolineales bacterium]